jgi:phosphohistidine phosphatase
MELLFLRHGAAEEKGARGGDAARRLTAAGRGQVSLVADAIRRAGVAPATCLSSPLARARETAEIACELLGCGELRESEALVPESDWERLSRALKPLPAGATVMLVGHQPSIGAMLAGALGADGASFPLPKAGAALVALPGASPPGELEWLLPPSLLERLMERGRTRRR